MTLLLIEEVTVATEYKNSADVFFEELVEVLLERTGINEYAIVLVDSKQLLHGPI